MATGTSPPISYDPFDAVIDREVHAVWCRMREEAPVYWNDRYGFWALSRFDDVWAAYHDTATFSSTHGVQPETLDEPIGLPLVIFMDPPEHDWMRKLVSHAFTPRRVAALEAHVLELVDRYLDPFVGSAGFDYVEQFGALLPPMVIGHMLGVPEADRDVVRHWFDDMLHHEDGTPAPSREGVRGDEGPAGLRSRDGRRPQAPSARRHAHGAARRRGRGRHEHAPPDRDGARVVRDAARGRRCRDGRAVVELGRGDTRPQSRPTAAARR